MVMAITIFIWILINSKEQHAINNVNGHRLLKKASKLVIDIKTYKRTTTNLRILKDHNKHTMYLQ